MSKRCISIIKLIIKLLLWELQLISHSSHSPKKTNFFKGAKIITHNILLTVDKLIMTLAVNRITCYEPLCAFSRNSLHYHQSYEETRVWGRYNVYKGRAQEELIYRTALCLSYAETYMIVFLSWIYRHLCLQQKSEFFCTILTTEFFS